MASNNSINNSTSFVQFPTNDDAPTPGSGGVLAVNTDHQPYYNNATDKYGLPLINNGGIPPQQGDTLAANAAGSWEAVALGAEGDVWTAGATTPGWAPPSGASGLATFLCQTSSDLPTNGIDISNPASTVTLGILQGDLDPYYQGATLTLYNNASSEFQGFPLQILTESDNSQIWLTTFSDTGAYQTVLNGQGSRGTLASPVAVSNNDVMFYIAAHGQTGTNVGDSSECANIRFVAEDNFATNPSGGIEFWTQQTTGGGLVKRVTINKTGLLTASNNISTPTLGATTVNASAVNSATAVLTSYWQVGQNDSIPTVGSGLTFGVTTLNLPYAKGASSTFGIPLVLSGSGGPAEGDQIVGNSTSSFNLVSIGTDGQLWKSNGTTAAWADPDYAPIVSGGAADTVGQATITAGNTSVTVNTTAVAAGSLILISISGFTGTASLALGQIATGNRVNGTSFDITIATVVPAVSTVTVDWLIINP